MKNNEFDDIIKRKLDGLNEHSSSSQWSSFKDKWESSNQSVSENDDQIDDQIRDHFKGLKVPFNSAHWVLLKNKLQIEARFRKNLYTAKSAEVAILFLIIFSILTFSPIKEQVYHIPIHDHPITAFAPIPLPKQEKQSLETNTITRLQIYNEINSNFEQHILSSSYHTSVEKRPHDSKTDDGLVKEIDNSSKIDGKPSFKKLTPISLPSHKLVLPQRIFGFPNISKLPENSNQVEHTYITLLAGPKINLINSPFDPIYDIDPYNTIATNFNIMLLLEKSFNRISLFGGVGYVSTNYKPFKVNETFNARSSDYYTTSLEAINFNVVQIPLGIRYDAIRGKKWETFISASIHTNLIASSTYTFKIREAGAQAFPAPSSTFNNPSQLNRNSKLSQKNFNEGILNGDRLSDNLFVTASLGFGIGVHLGKNHELILNPTYSHYLSNTGLGPNEDRLHSFNMMAGIRLNLN